MTLQSDIARMIEQTAGNLRGLESCIHAVRNDLGQICDAVGYPQGRLSLGATRVGTQALGAWAAQAGLGGTPGSFLAPQVGTPVAVYNPFVQTNPYTTYGAVVPGQNPYAPAFNPFAAALPTSHVTFGPYGTGWFAPGSEPH